MRTTLKTGAAVLMLACMAGNLGVDAAQAATCANSNEMRAVRAAAVQQRLMVAAFTCRAIAQYNKFVTAYQTDLQQSDRQLQDFFRRLYGQSGISNYHSFKTRLANTSSIQSINDSGLLRRCPGDIRCRTERWQKIPGGISFYADNRSGKNILAMRHHDGKHKPGARGPLTGSVPPIAMAAPPGPGRGTKPADPRGSCAMRGVLIRILRAPD